MMTHHVLAALLALHAAALYLFTTGFFLTRFEVADISTCQVSPSSHPVPVPHLRGGPQDVANSTSCWMPRRFRRIVFVVIDALRFDFAASKTSTHSSPFYSGRLPVLNETLTNEPGHALLMKFVADPPTMTMQRLKGLTTGSLPTFLDIKDNMAASSQIAEDNLLHQFRAQKRGIVFMGDDTWNALYERAFTRKFAFDSFNVKDLHSVDRGVTRHLFPELHQSDWDLLIAHFLGVDHVGHTHGPTSVFMAEKLDEMNEVLSKLLHELKTMPDADDVLLAVLGDHGMSADGNHGGASDEETGAALFLYSKKPLVAIDEDGDEAFQTYAKNLLDRSREVPQVDLVPTLALLSGLPIPFANLGCIIPSLFFFPSQSTKNSSAVTAFETLNRALRLNLDQVRRYLFRYSSASKLPQQAYHHLETIFQDIKRIEKQLEQVHGSHPGFVDSRGELPLLLRLHEDLAKLQQRYLREALSLGRSIWTQFDLCSMGWGMLLLFWTFIIGAVAARSVNSSSSKPWSPPLLATAGVGSVLLVSPARISLPLLPAPVMSRALIGAACVCLANMTRHFAFQRPTSALPTKAVARSILLCSSSAVWVASAIVVVLHALSLLSNSYIVAENRVMQFLSATTGVFLLVSTQRFVTNRHVATGAALAFLFATRLSTAFDPPNIIKAAVTLEQTFAPLLALAILAVGSEQILKYAGRNISRMGRFMLTLSVASYCVCAIFWAASPIHITFWRLWLPRIVYLNFLGVFASLVTRIIRQKRRKSSSRQMDLMESDHLLLIWQLVPAFMLVLGPSSPLSVLCLVVQCLSLALVISCHRSNLPASSGDITPWILLWASCSYQAFFTSGHANTFTSLQNAAGFVGFDTFNFYLAGMLLGLNTFGSFALAILALPWLSLPQASQRATASLAFAAYFALNALVSTFFVALQRRHLMVWAIFAPKFIFDGMTLLVTECLLLLLYTPFQ